MVDMQFSVRLSRLLRDLDLEAKRPQNTITLQRNIMASRNIGETLKRKPIGCYLPPCCIILLFLLAIKFTKTDSRRKVAYPKKKKNSHREVEE